MAFIGGLNKKWKTQDWYAGRTQTSTTTPPRSGFKNLRRYTLTFQTLRNPKSTGSGGSYPPGNLLPHPNTYRKSNPTLWPTFLPTRMSAR